MDYELTARAALARLDFKAKNALGQNFLLSPEVLAALADDAGVEGGDLILEIGAGAGTLTAEMASRGARVLAVELDTRLEPVLDSVLAPYPTATVIYGDALRIDLPRLWREQLGGPFRVVANLPYGITTEIVEKLLQSNLPIRSLSLLVQLEAAQRMQARPGEKAYGMLAVMAQYYAEVRTGMSVPRGAFTPPPHVESCAVHLTMRESPAVACAPAPFFRAVRAAFAMRRKTLVNNLCAGYSLPRERALDIVKRCGLSETVRGEALTLEQLAAVARAVEE